MSVHGVLYLLFLESKKMGLHYQFSQSCYTNGLCKAVFWLCQFAWEFFPTDTRDLLCGVNVFSKGMDFYDLKVYLVQYEAYCPCCCHQLRGYQGTSALALQIFIGTADERLLKPHAFYQVHRITGKTVTTPSLERMINGTKVLEIPLEPKSHMRVV